jgi:hypothetical protein
MREVEMELDGIDGVHVVVGSERAALTAYIRRIYDACYTADQPGVNFFSM